MPPPPLVSTALQSLGSLPDRALGSVLLPSLNVPTPVAVPVVNATDSALEDQKVVESSVQRAIDSATANEGLRKREDWCWTPIFWVKPYCWTHHHDDDQPPPTPPPPPPPSLTVETVPVDTITVPVVLTVARPAEERTVVTTIPAIHTVETIQNVLLTTIGVPGAARTLDIRPQSSAPPAPGPPLPNPPVPGPPPPGPFDAPLPGETPVATVNVWKTLTVTRPAEERTVVSTVPAIHTIETIQNVLLTTIGVPGAAKTLDIHPKPSAPPSDGSTPPSDGSTPPSDGGRPPSDGGNPPSDPPKAGGGDPSPLPGGGESPDSIWQNPWVQRILGWLEALPVPDPLEHLDDPHLFDGIPMTDPFITYFKQLQVLPPGFPPTPPVTPPSDIPPPDSPPSEGSVNDIGHGWDNHRWQQFLQEVDLLNEAKFQQFLREHPSEASDMAESIWETTSSSIHDVDIPLPPASVEPPSTELVWEGWRAYLEYPGLVWDGIKNMFSWYSRSAFHWGKNQVGNFLKKADMANPKKFAKFLKKHPKELSEISASLGGRKKVSSFKTLKKWLGPLANKKGISAAWAASIFAIPLGIELSDRDEEEKKDPTLVEAREKAQEDFKEIREEVEKKKSEKDVAFMVEEAQTYEKEKKKEEEKRKDEEERKPSQKLEDPTMTPGGAIPVPGTPITTAELAPTAIVTRTEKQRLDPITAAGAVGSPPAFSFGGSTFTENSASAFVIGTQTLTPGGVVTVDGSTISLAPSATAVVVINTMTEEKRLQEEREWVKEKVKEVREMLYREKIRKVVEEMEEREREKINQDVEEWKRKAEQIEKEEKERIKRQKKKKNCGPKCKEGYDNAIQEMSEGIKEVIDFFSHVLGAKKQKSST